jgi:hypothetical protein
VWVADIYGLCIVGGPGGAPPRGWQTDTVCPQGGGNIFDWHWAQPFLGLGCKNEVRPSTSVWVVFGVIDISPGGRVVWQYGMGWGTSCMCVLGFELVLGVAFLCRGLTIILLLEGLFIDCQNKGRCVWVYDFLKYV